MKSSVTRKFVEAARRSATLRKVYLTLRKVYLVLACYRREAIRRPFSTAQFILFDPEITNFTYEISNYDELARFVALSMDRDELEARRMCDELRDDYEFEARLTSLLRRRSDRKPKPLYGRRVGWYAFVRILRPRLVIESGVADGLGSAVLLHALERNRAEGYSGNLIGIDIHSASSWLVPRDLRAHYQLVIEDSKRALMDLPAAPAVDLFIHDSFHEYAHETEEYRIILRRLSSRGVILSDNAHASSALADFSRAQGRSFWLFRERPIGHFYPGAGIGASLPR